MDTRYIKKQDTLYPSTVPVSVPVSSLTHPSSWLPDRDVERQRVPSPEDVDPQARAPHQQQRGLDRADQERMHPERGGGASGHECLTMNK